MRIGSQLMKFCLRHTIQHCTKNNEFKAFNGSFNIFKMKIINGCHKNL